MITFEKFVKMKVDMVSESDDIISIALYNNLLLREGVTSGYKYLKSWDDDTGESLFYPEDKSTPIKEEDVRSIFNKNKRKFVKAILKGEGRFKAMYKRCLDEKYNGITMYL